MISWEERPVEVANLLNPAFCAMIIRDAVAEYTDDQKEGMPYVLAFLILPITLHMPTRVALPKNIRPPLHLWLDQHPQSKVELSARVHRVSPFTREAIIFAAQKGFITISLNSNLQSSQLSPRPSSWTENTEVYQYLKAAQLLGRWFASTGDIATIFRLWGIRP